MNTAVNSVKPSFPVRRMDYVFDDSDRYWMANDPVSTHYFTALSLLFPEGEQYFVDAVRAIRDQVKNNPQLAKDIGAFIGQEAMHSKEHHAFHAVARKYRLDPDSLEKMVGTVLKQYFTFRSKQLNLALTAGLEHFTAVLVVKMMADVSYRITDDTIRNLWLWHSVEETEHKAVAFDAYQQLYGTGITAYAARTLMFTVGVAMLFGVQSNMMIKLLFRDKQLYNLKSWRKFATMMALDFPPMIPKMLQYYRPNFHPNDTDESELVAQTKIRIGLIDRPMTQSTGLPATLLAVQHQSLPA